jgi:hypothetical protein
VTIRRWRDDLDGTWHESGDLDQWDVEQDAARGREHEVAWIDQRSFNFRLRCACGWESHLHLMEKDALAEGREHLGLRPE